MKHWRFSFRNLRIGMRHRSIDAPMTSSNRISTISTGLAVVALGAFAAWIRLGPLPGDLLAAADDVSTMVVDRNGTPLYEARTRLGTRSARLEAADLPRPLVDATMAAEDRRFRQHPGIDPIAVARAAVRNVRAGRVVEGASTITQQVAKLLLAQQGARRSVGRIRTSERRPHEA